VGVTRTPENFDPAAIYDEGYFQGGRPDGYADYTSSEAVIRGEFRKVLSHLLRYGPVKGRLLELGCAYGFFLLEAQGHFKCTGVEISAAAAASCRSRGLEVSGEALDSAFVRDRGPYEVVVMLDVIEHLTDPAATLSQLRDLLSDRGLLMITTGDWQSPFARLTGRSWRLMTPPQHLFFFSRRSLKMLLERSGFEVVDMVRPWKHVPLGLVAYQVGNRLGFRVPFLESIHSFGLPINLFDSMRVIARKKGPDRETPLAPSSDPRPASQ
jgi:SAM-dependent methyltransferase